MLSIIFASCEAFAQNVIHFNGIPVDGTRKQVENKLAKAGYEYSEEQGGYVGWVDGREVCIDIYTNLDKVYSIAVRDLWCSYGEDAAKLYNSIHDKLYNNDDLEFWYFQTITSESDLWGYLGGNTEVTNLAQGCYNAPGGLVTCVIYGWCEPDSSGEQRGAYYTVTYYENFGNAPQQ